MLTRPTLRPTLRPTACAPRRPLARPALLLAAVAASGALAGCGGGGSSAGPSGDLVIKGYAFQPVTLTVKPGQVVTVANQDQVAHDVQSDREGLFSTAAISGGKALTFTAPTQPGTYSYICSFHPDMKATLVVQ